MRGSWRVKIIKFPWYWKQPMTFFSLPTTLFCLTSLHKIRCASYLWDHVGLIPLCFVVFLSPYFRGLQQKSHVLYGSGTSSNLSEWGTLGKDTDWEKIYSSGHRSCSGGLKESRAKLHVQSWWRSQRRTVNIPRPNSFKCTFNETAAILSSMSVT